VGWRAGRGGGRLGLLAPAFAARMDFRILGPLEALDGGRVVRLGGSRQRALLALFVLHANETLSTDRLIDELWGERPPTGAAKTVQVHISRLRKTLAGGQRDGSAATVATREHGYELRLDPERLDAHRFERLLAEGRSELAAGRPERAAAALEVALSLWRGPPLADLAYEPFAQREIARLDELRVAAREQLIEARLALGAHAELVGQLEALIAEHPFRERLRALLMLALYRSDRQADALQAYQDARRTLSRSWASSRASGCANSSGRSWPRTPGYSCARGPSHRRRTPRAACSWAARASWRSWPAASTTPAPAAGACSCSSASPASARAAWPTS
jgi:DNA-binding SARP family transcriptional activator